MIPLGRLLVCCLLGFAAGLDKEEWMAAMKSLDFRYGVDQSNDDMHDLAALHTDDVIVMPPSLPTVHGIEAYKDAIQMNRTGENFYWITETSADLVQYVEEFAIVKNEFEFKQTSDSEKKRGKCMAFLQNHNGKTKIKLVVWNYSF